MESVRGSGYQGKSDEDWIEEFSSSGRNVFVSADRKMLRRPTMVQNIINLDLMAFFLPGEWGQKPRHYQAAHILYWWPKIEECIQISPAGMAWLVPKGFGTGDLRQHVEAKGRKG